MGLVAVELRLQAKSQPSRTAVVEATTAQTPVAVYVSPAGRGSIALSLTAPISARIKAAVWTGSASALRASVERTVELNCAL